VNVPLGAIVIVAGLRVIPASLAQQGTRHFDALGAVLVTAALVALTFGIVRTDTVGWGSPGVLGPLAAGLALLAGFVLVEARLARVPLVPLDVFRVGALRAANLVVVLLYAAFFPVWFFLTIYLQQVLGYDAIEAGISFLPMTLSIFAASSLAPRLVGRFGPRRVIGSGMLLATGGMALLSGISPGGSYAAAVLPGALLTSIGMGLSLVPSTIVAMQGLPGSLSGLGSGLLNTSRLMGGALGLAILSTIADAATRHDAAAGAAASLSHGFGLAFVVGAAFCFAGAGAAIVLLRRLPDTTLAAAPANASAIDRERSEEREPVAA
jgi:Na+/melibiose symporter-like transporter